MQDKYININGINTRYWDEGQGDKTIVFVHGLAACIEHWEKTIPAFKDNYRVITMDLVGFGLTDKPAIDYTAEVFVQFVKEFLDALNIDSCIMVGHSMGGGIVANFAVDYPDHVERLVLISSAGFYRKLPFPLRIAAIRGLGKALMTNRPRIASAVMMRKFAYQKDQISESLIDKIHYYYHTPGAKAAIVSLLKENANLFGIRLSILKLMKTRVPELTMPVLIIWGEEDNLLPIKGGEIAAKWIPQAEFYRMPKCGHMPQLECADEVNALLQSFIN